MMVGEGRDKITGLHQDDFPPGSGGSVTPILFGSWDLLLFCLTKQPGAPHGWTLVSHAVTESHSTENMCNSSLKPLCQGSKNFL